MADREDQDLSISSVLSGKVTPNEKLLYASKLDWIKTKDTIIELKETSATHINKTNELITNVNSVLASTNSNRFYSGEEAQLHIKDINKISTDMEEIQNHINNINESDIGFVISKYNIELNKLKKGAKLTMLKEAADKWNAGKHVDRVEEQQLPYDSSIPLEGEHKYAFKDFVDHEVKIVGTKDGITTIKTTYYKYINYWKWFTGEFWPFDLLDDNESTLEAKFLEYGVSLPYDPSKVIDYEK